ncbi:MAG: hypothetical protein ACR2MX_07265 [Cyclobacteriaceae bacterium]
MELQELVGMWNEQDQKLEGNIQLNRQLLKKVSLDKVKSLLSEFTLESILEAALNAFFFWIILQFVWAQWPVIKFVVPGIILLVTTFLSFLGNMYELVSLASIGYESSVVEAQKKIERLRFYQRIDRNSLYVIIPLFSLFFPIWFAWAFLGLDLFDILGIGWVYHFIGSLGIAAIIVWFLKRFPDRKMAKAIKFLEEIKKFEEGN